MTNRSSQRQRQRNQRNARTRRNAKAQRGGELSGNPASAWGWGLGTVGNGWTQFMNSLTLQPGQNLGTSQSNNIVPVNNINAQDAQPMLKPNMSGGKRHRKSHVKRHRKSRGGNFAAVLNQAAVPGILLAAQQTFGKSRKRR